MIDGVLSFVSLEFHSVDKSVAFLLKDIFALAWQAALCFWNHTHVCEHDFGPITFICSVYHLWYISIYMLSFDLHPAVLNVSAAWLAPHMLTLAQDGVHTSIKLILNVYVCYKTPRILCLLPLCFYVYYL